MGNLWKSYGIQPTPQEPSLSCHTLVLDYLCKQDAVVAYIWAWLYCAYVKFVMCMRDMWVVQWYCIFEGLVEMCLITKMMGVVCEVVAGFL